MTNPGERFLSNKQEKVEVFEALYQKLLLAEGSFLEYNVPYPKVEFLRYLSEKKNLLIHGSNFDIEKLEPRQANCKSKKFGNLNAVYATEDPILPVFYAIKDKNKFRGMAISGADIHSSNGFTETSYIFKVEPEMLAINPWSPGVIYVLSKDSFEQGTDDEGDLIDEWISREEVKQLAKIKVAPEDFPYLADIKTIPK
jgi:hypothetical protein